MPYTTLADVYAAILRGDLERQKLFAIADGGHFSIYQSKSEGAEKIYDGHEEEALQFVAALMGIGYEQP